MWDSRYPMWLLLPHGGRLCRKMLWLSQYCTSACSLCFHFFAHWHFSCCSSVSLASESEAVVAALFRSFFSFFFFLFSLVSPCSESSPRLLLGEPVHCVLMGGSGVVSGVRPFLDSVCSLFQGVFFCRSLSGSCHLPRGAKCCGHHRWHLLRHAVGCHLS